MSLFLAWVVFPLVMSVLSLGLGLLAETIAGVRLRGTLLLPTGFAAMIVVSGLTTMASATAELTVPAVVALAVAGLLFGLRRPRTFDYWPALSALAVFAVFAAPVVFSGSATFTGWIKLDDGATWLAFADRLVDHGRNVTGLAPSTYEVVLAHNLGNGYPVGAFVPLGVGGKLVPEDIAWLLQPFMAFGAALLALALYDLVSRVVESRGLRALVAFVAAQGALYYGYALWGGAKEIVAAPLVAVTAALTGDLLRKHSSVRVAIPLAVAGAAVVGVQSFGGGIWLLPILLPAAWLLFRGRGLGFTLRSSGLFAAVSIVVSIPTIVTAGTWATELRASSVATGGDILGNLFAPLKLAQGMGIWPVGDFRVSPLELGPTYVLIGVAALAAAAGFVHSVRRRAPELPLFLASGVLSALVLTQFASPWIGGKALATAVPALVASAMVGACWLIESDRRVEGVVLAVALAGGVLWSNVLQYHDVSLAPRTQLAELETIGRRYAGQGPGLMTEYNPYGARYFLRALDGESAGEFRRHLIPLLDGKPLEKGADADIDEFQTQPVLFYRTLVLRRSATGSRPPSLYRLVERGRFYDVWQRPELGAPKVLEHLPLGNKLEPAAVASCADVRRLARVAGANGLLAAVTRPNPRVVDLSAVSVPAGWSSDQSHPGAVVPMGAGDAATVVTMPHTGRYTFSLGGSFRDRLEVFVDEHRIFSGRHQLNWAGNYTPVGEVELRRGRHLVLVRYGGPDLWPGSGGPQRSFGPLVFAPSFGSLPVTYVKTNDASSLCGKRLDWIEALSS
jgi:hypothetical protein